MPENEVKRIQPNTAQQTHAQSIFKKKKKKYRFLVAGHFGFDFSFGYCEFFGARRGSKDHIWAIVCRMPDGY